MNVLLIISKHDSLTARNIPQKHTNKIYLVEWELPVARTLGTG